MDYQNRHASKPGAGGPASSQQTEIERKERLRQLAMEMVDLDKVRHSNFRRAPWRPSRLRRHTEPACCALLCRIHTCSGIMSAASSAACA